MGGETDSTGIPRDPPLGTACLRTTEGPRAPAWPAAGGSETTVLATARAELRLNLTMLPHRVPLALPLMLVLPPSGPAEAGEEAGGHPRAEGAEAGAGTTPALLAG